MLADVVDYSLAVVTDVVRGPAGFRSCRSRHRRCRHGRPFLRHDGVGVLLRMEAGGLAEAATSSSIGDGVGPLQLNPVTKK